MANLYNVRIVNIILIGIENNIVMHFSKSQVHIAYTMILQNRYDSSLCNFDILEYSV